MKRYDPETMADMEEATDGEYVLHREACPPWTKELPTKPGAYWMRTVAGGYAALCRVSQDENATVLSITVENRDWTQDIDETEFGAYEWCGSLYQPE